MRLAEKLGIGGAVRLEAVLVCRYGGTECGGCQEWINPAFVRG